MKYFRLLTLLLLTSVISFYACNDNASADAVRQKAEETLDVSASPPNAATPTPATPEPAQNAAGVWHYTCSKGCEGGAGAAGPCATCGGTLAHNAAYHDQANSPTTATPETPTVTPTPTPPTSPAQNAAGVWHYTCSKGCAGGAGAAGACASCGGTLAHNAAYHQ